ncbi:MAG: hypothetical protein HYX74_05735 [Acidobacteria bacterium]|nr:hypothetical protein [Acidobacteriota bacterium]
MKSTRFICALSLIFFQGTAGDALARPQGETEEVQAQSAGKETGLLLGFDTSAPGFQVSVPLILQAAGEVSIGSITAKVEFPKVSLEFQHAKLGLAAELADAQVSANLKTDEASPDHSVVQVMIATEGGKTLQSGVVANLVFKISEDAAVGDSLALKITASVLTAADPPKAVHPVVSEDGEVQVAATPPVITSCFFYMH